MDSPPFNTPMWAGTTEHPNPRFLAAPTRHGHDVADCAGAGSIGPDDVLRTETLATSSGGLAVENSRSDGQQGMAAGWGRERLASCGHIQDLCSIRASGRGAGTTGRCVHDSVLSPTRPTAGTRPGGSPTVDPPGQTGRRQPSRGCLHSAPPVRVQPRSACRDPARPRVEPDGICACPRVRGGLPVPRLPRLTSKANQRDDRSQPRPSLGRGWLATWTYFEPDPAVDRWSACEPSTRGETGRVLKRHRHSRDDEVCQEGSEIVAELGGGSGPLLPTIWSSSSDGVTGHASRRPRRNDVDQ